MQEICTASQTERQEKMEKLSNPQKTIEVIKKYDFAFQKKFGQNFLIDAHVLNKIIASADITKDVRDTGSKQHCRCQKYCCKFFSHIFFPFCLIQVERTRELLRYKVILTIRQADIRNLLYCLI